MNIQRRIRDCQRLLQKVEEKPVEGFSGKSCIGWGRGLDRLKRAKLIRTKIVVEGLIFQFQVLPPSVFDLPNSRATSTKWQLNRLVEFIESLNRRMTSVRFPFQFEPRRLARTAPVQVEPNPKRQKPDSSFSTSVSETEASYRHPPRLPTFDIPARSRRTNNASNLPNRPYPSNTGIRGLYRTLGTG